jgi:hypothetical protein
MAWQTRSARRKFSQAYEVSLAMFGSAATRVLKALTMFNHGITWSTMAEVGTLVFVGTT